MNTTVLVGGATSRARMEPAGGVPGGFPKERRCQRHTGRRFATAAAARAGASLRQFASVS